MGLISARQAAKKWGISQRRVSQLCQEGRIPSAQQVGNMWVISSYARKPVDARMLNGKAGTKTGNNPANKIGQELGTKYDSQVGSCEKVLPFLKWVGGKGQLLSEISKLYPFEHNPKITKYAEPFVGGGAVLFDILSRYKLQAVYISDLNPELINVYTVIRNQVEDLIAPLLKIQADYWQMSLDERKAYYNTKRKRFNELKLSALPRPNLELAVLFVFLNHTCFNGLYRVNKRGLFNVPVGYYHKPLICNEGNLRLVAQKLQGVNIVCEDYRASEQFIDEHTFVYFDPPYRPLSNTACFKDYTSFKFNDQDQLALAEFVNRLNERGALVVVSNSDPKNADAEDNFFEEAYATHSIKRVYANRTINCNSKQRGRIKELIISNF